MQYKSTRSLPTSTAEENPARIFPSTYRCMAAWAGRKSYPLAVTFMSSMITPPASDNTSTATRSVATAGRSGPSGRALLHRVEIAARNIDEFDAAETRECRLHQLVQLRPVLGLGEDLLGSSEI